MKPRSELMLEAHRLLEQWLEARQKVHGGECTQQEWTDFLTMQRRTCVWNRRLMTTYCAYLRQLSADGEILMNRPQVYTLEQVMSL